MAHHSFEMDDEQRRILDSTPFADHDKGEPILDRLKDLGDRRNSMVENLGPTGEFPDGKLGDNDEGEFRYRVGSMDGRVVVDFGAPMHSLGLLPDQAEELAKSLMRQVMDCRKDR